MCACAVDIIKVVCIISQPPNRLLGDGDAARLGLLGLGHGDAQDAVLEASRDGVMLHRRREVKGARELADAALGEPVLVLGRLGLGLRLLGGGGGALVLDGCLVRRLAALGDGGLVGDVLDLVGRRGALGVGALGPAADRHRLRLGEFNVDRVLVHAGQLAVQLVGVVGLADVKLGLPDGGACASAVGLAARLAGVAVKVVEEAEERGEG